jgi:hypothetical protein
MVHVEQRGIARTRKTIARIFDLERYSTQYQITKNQLEASHQDKNSSSHINNIRQQIPFLSKEEVSHPFVGYIQPTPNSYSSPEGWDDKYLFRADYNNSLDAFSKNNVSGIFRVNAYGSKTRNLRTVFDDASQKQHLINGMKADGIVFHSNTDETLYYPTKKENSPPWQGGIFPPLTNKYSYKDGVSKGSLSFWFKINKTWKKTDWRTIFFATNSYKALSKSGNSYLCGLQRELQMRVIPFHNQFHANTGLYKQVEFQVRYKWFTYLQRSDWNFACQTPIELWPFSNQKHPGYIEDSARFVLSAIHNKQGKRFGIKAQEWYHVACSWKNGLEIPQQAFAISGNFYRIQKGQSIALQKKGPIIFQRYDQDLVQQFQHPQGVICRQFYDSQANFSAISDKNTRLNNRFYVGFTGRTIAPQITIDDVRISDHNEVKEISYFPSRYQANRNKENIWQYGSFFSHWKQNQRGFSPKKFLEFRPWGQIYVESSGKYFANYPLEVWQSLWLMVCDGIIPVHQWEEKFGQSFFQSLSSMSGGIEIRVLQDTKFFVFRSGDKKLEFQIKANRLLPFEKNYRWNCQFQNLHQLLSKWVSFMQQEGYLNKSKVLLEVVPSYLSFENWSSRSRLSYEKENYKINFFRVLQEGDVSIVRYQASAIEELKILYFPKVVHTDYVSY